MDLGLDSSEDENYQSAEESLGTEEEEGLNKQRVQQIRKFGETS